MSRQRLEDFSAKKKLGSKQLQGHEEMKIDIKWSNTYLFFINLMASENTLHVFQCLIFMHQ